MPSLIIDPRYALLPSQAEREAVFNEWCREVSRASRLAKVSAKLHASPSNVTDTTEADTSNANVRIISEPQKLRKEEEKRQAREAYDVLLNMEVASTRMTWEEFKRNWKKDRRFFGFGRDDRERETVFRAHLKGLGESKRYPSDGVRHTLSRVMNTAEKRAQAKKAELDFMNLLKEHKVIIPIMPDSSWKEVHIIQLSLCISIYLHCRSRRHEAWSKIPGMTLLVLPLSEKNFLGLFSKPCARILLRLLILRL